MTLPLDPILRLGVQAILRRIEPAPHATAAPWLPRIDKLAALQLDSLRGPTCAVDGSGRPPHFYTCASSLE